MNIINLLFLYFLFNIFPSSKEQYFVTEPIIELSGEMGETSGLLRINGRIITLNDSGGRPHLYEIDTLGGEIFREVIVANAQNRDWEDIAQDNKYIYIGDIGNNNGNRRDLVIYRILKRDYLKPGNDSVYADKINFHYITQTDFSPKRYSNNFDAEALIATRDSLYLFSKNWINMKTYLYAIPKTPGNYGVQISDSLNVKGLVTGAVYDPVSGSVMLSGYTPSSNFVVGLSDYKDDDFFKGKVIKYLLELDGSKQTEGICLDRRGGFFLSAEKTRTYPAMLYRIYPEPDTGGRD